MTTTFHIYNMTSVQRRSCLGERPTFAEAERLARWHAARGNIRVSIVRTVATASRKPGRGEEVASVVRDALGRLWTDLTWEGALLV